MRKAVKEREKNQKQTSPSLNYAYLIFFKKYKLIVDSWAWGAWKRECSQH